MGMYAVNCPTCGNAHHWFSSNFDQRCVECQLGGLGAGQAEIVALSEKLSAQVTSPLTVTPPTPKLYRKKPMPVQAIRWFKLGDEPTGTEVEKYGLTFKFNTPSSIQFLNPGDWIVGPGYYGDYLVIQNEAFMATYEICP